jgi:F-type H+-transporting ATPase subunit a
MNTTISVGIFSFLLYNLEGLRTNGLGYLKHFLGPVLWLAPLMVIIEVISNLVRPMSLGIRLFGNMTGDHTVLSIFLNLVPIGVPIIFYALGLFVCLVQAFIFSLLSMVYLSMATAHDH